MLSSLKNKVSSLPLGLGCWAIGGSQWGDQNIEDSVATLKKAFDLGIDHFDTAQSYGDSEKILGRSFHHCREQIFIASKAVCRESEKFKTCVENSLRNLNTDYIDLYYIHWPFRGNNIGQMIETLETFRNQGVIKTIGISNFSVARTAEAIKAGKVDYYQLGYNLLWRFRERDIIPFCRANNIKVVAYSPLAQGILTGKFGRDIVFAPGDNRVKMVLFDPQYWPQVYNSVEQLKQVATMSGRALEHLSLRWLMDHSGVDLVLAGSRTPEQAINNFNALDGEISCDVFEKMTAISDALHENLTDTDNMFRNYPDK